MSLRICRALAALVGVTACGCAVPIALLAANSFVDAQTEDAPPTPPPQGIDRPRARPAATVVAENLTAHARRDVVTVVVPWADADDYRGEPLSVDDDPKTRCQVSRFGATWPDGSWRYSRVVLPVRLPRGPGAVSVRLLRGGAGVAPAFSWSQRMLSRLPRLAFGLRVGGEVLPLAAWETIEDGHLLRAWRARARHATLPLWAELTLEIPTGAEHGRWWLQYGDSSLADPAVVHDLPEIGLLVAGASVVVRHRASKVRGSSVSPEGVLIDLLPAERWGDGESQAVTGSILLWGGIDPETIVAEAQAPVLACSSDWARSGAFGPWGEVPAMPPGFDRQASWNMAAAEYQAGGAAWEPGMHACAPVPSGTGDQRDFSAAVMTDVASGFPARIHSVQRSVYQEACRPTHVRANDGSPYAFGANRLLHIWGNQVFHRTSPDKLGKTTEPGSVHGFRGHDRQHYSINYLATLALLTADRWAVSECQHHAELWLQACRTDSGNPTIDGMDAARAVGRTLHAGALLWLVTGRDDLARVMRDRVDVTERQWAGRQTSPVRPLSIYPPRGNALSGTVPFWLPWQEAIAVQGLDAAWQVTGYAPARDLGALCGASLWEHGAWEDSGGYLGVGQAVEWRGGATGGEREHPSTSMGSAAWMYSDWAHPSSIVGARELPIATTSAAAVAAFRAQELARGAPSWRAMEWRAVR